MQPGFPSLLAGANTRPGIAPTATSSGRRTAVADWIASADNPLTARVFVNRQWAQVFGSGIVETVSDFGRMGAKPTDPELLDWLASDFVANGWSVKKLSREIFLSRTYRQASTPRAEAEKIDPTDKLLWAFPRQRLEAEEIRDSLLQAAGLLEDRLGGPAVFPPLPADTQAPNRNVWITSDNPHEVNRRSVYVFVRRNLPYPLLDTFDWANPQIVHNKRDVTTTAPQALALINSDLVYAWSKALAGRVIREAGQSDAARIDRVYEILYARQPDAFEKSRLLAFLSSQQGIEAAQLAAGKKINLPDGFGVAPPLNAEIEKLYKVAYGRAPDRFEQAALVEFIDRQKQKETRWATAPNPNYDPAALAAAANTAANTPPPDDGNLGADSSGAKDDPEAAHAAAFVDLVHALSNANDFLYRMEKSAPEAVDLGKETAATKALYGIGTKETEEYGTALLRARRLVERGVRFIHVISGPTDSSVDSWDAHNNLEKNHGVMCKLVDKPVAGLLADLKSRGLLETTLVVWTSEFGRTPYGQSGNGRDHNPWGYTQWMAGGGIKPGTYGSTDEIGLRAQTRAVNTYDFGDVIKDIVSA